MLQLLAQMTLNGTEVVVNQQKWEYEAGWWNGGDNYQQNCWQSNESEKECVEIGITLVRTSPHHLRVGIHLH